MDLIQTLKRHPLLTYFVLAYIRPLSMNGTKNNTKELDGRRQIG